MTPTAFRALYLAQLDAALANHWVQHWMSAEQLRWLKGERAFWAAASEDEVARLWACVEASE